MALYLIAYSYKTDPSADIGYGDIILTISYKLTEEVIQEIREQIETTHNFSSVVFSNFIKLEE